MLKKLAFLSVLFCWILSPLHAQEATFTLVSEFDVEGVAQFSVGSMALSPDGKLLAVILGTQFMGTPSEEGYNGVILYDTQSGEPAATLDLEGAISTAFSLDGTLFAVSGNGTVVFDLPKLLEARLVNAESAEEYLARGVVRNIISDVEKSWHIAFLPDNTTLFTEGDSNTLWDIAQPSDFSNSGDIPAPESIPLTPPDGAEFVRGSFISSEAGAFALVKSSQEDNVQYLPVQIEPDGTVTRLGLPYQATEQTFAVLNSDGTLISVASFDANAPDTLLVETLRIRADDVPESLFVQTIPTHSAFNFAPNGLYGVMNTITDGQAVAQFYSTERGETVGTLPVLSVGDSYTWFSSVNRLAVSSVGLRSGNGTIRVYDVDGLDFGLGLTEVTAIDSLGMGLDLPTLTDPEDCETDGESLMGETTESTCNLSGDVLTLDTALTLSDGNDSVTLMYPSVMAIDQPSENGVILGTSQSVLEKDFATVPPMSAGEAAITVTMSGLANLPLESTEGVTTPRQVMDGFVSFLTNVDVVLDGAIIDTFAGEYPASVAYFNNANGDVMLLVAQVTPQFYAVFIVISAPDEIILIEPTVYAMAETLVGASAD